MTTPARDSALPSNALARLLDTPDLPSAVRRLAPDVLHQLIRTAGLDECGHVIALATPEQLRPYTARSTAWLDALRRGAPVPPPR